MKNNVVIKVENLSKKYTIGNGGSNSLRDRLENLIRSPFTPVKKKNQDFWALKNVSFEVNKGEVVGIIGKNGAGKSTILKILSGITEPTQGKVTIKGTTASLLEVGTGFNPELTGRENIFLNGSILGMTKIEIRNRFQEIVDFSGIKKFIDTPVKRYSSGMFVRLAFSVAANLKSEVMIIDEVLAVGDDEFQKKSLKKMNELAKSGRTILFVTHNMGAVSKLCSRSIYLKDGKVISIDRTEKAVQDYLAPSTRVYNGKIDKSLLSGPLLKSMSFRKIAINNKVKDIALDPGKGIKIIINGTCTKPLNKYSSTIAIFRHGIRLFSIQDSKSFSKLEKGDFKSTYKINAHLLRPGNYSIALGGWEDELSEWIYGEDIYTFSITEKWSDKNLKINLGVINVNPVGKRTKVK